MPEITSNSTGLSGEYFVAGELLRRGFNVAITMGNAKSIDLIAEKNGRTFPIQVKSIFKKKNVGWPILKSKIKKKHFYIFVNLNGDKLTNPEFFICTSFEAKRKIREYATRGILNLYLINNDKFKNRWDKIK
uniref:PD(D/E)XK endonuclease domain-containing protein n=1 Tax=Ignavibacterium album TaxID=591197 RepID=A0A7V2ZKP9_9BACT